MKTKILFYGLLLPLLLLIGWISYLLYGSYTGYHSAQQNSTAVTLSHKVDKMIESISSELSHSAGYFASLGVSGKEALTKRRAETNKEIDSVISAANENLGKQKVVRIRQDIVEIRSGTDALSGAYTGIIGLPFQKNIEIPAVKLVEDLQSRISGKDQHTYMRMYQTLLNTISNLSDEQAFLRYTVLAQKAISDEGLSFWESLASKDLLPKLQSLQNQTFADEINDLLENSKEQHEVDLLRAHIFMHFQDGVYTVTEKEILNVYGKLIKKAEVSAKMIAAKMSDSLQSNIDTAQNKMLQYVAILAILLGVLLLLLRTFSSAAKEKKELESALREMVSHLDEVRQKELDDIIKRGDTVATYRFLAKTTQEAHEARQEAIEAEKAKDLFLANMSHEIRTPLNGILGFTQLLEGTKLDGEQNEFLDVVKTSSNSLLKIVNDILDLSKIKADKMDLEYISFNAIDILSDAVEPHETKASDKKIEYTTFIDPELPHLMGDPTKISQVMTNLIGNAMKFTDYRGTVNVSVDKIDETIKDVTVRFSVKDNGLGISPEQQEHIFHAFSQADISTTREFGGTGLGLTITNSLVERMGGNLEVESEVGKGAEFYFTLVFERGNIQEEESYQYDGLKVGYFKPLGTPRKTVEINLTKYMRATGAVLEEFSSLDPEVVKSYDVVISDYSFIETRDNIGLITSMAKHTIVLTYIAYSDEARKLLDSVDSVIYKPLNILKIMKALEKAYLGIGQSASIEGVPKQETRTKEVSFHGARLLVVEDNVINQKLISEIIKNLGADIEIANNGREAVERRQSTIYDMILMDIQMPILGGIEATQEIIAWEEGEGVEHTPIIALTANALQGDREKYLQAGMDDYLSKPIDIGNLKRVLSQYYNGSEAIRSDSVDELVLPEEILTEKETLNKVEVVSENKTSFTDEKVLLAEEVYEKESSIDEKGPMAILVYTHNMLIYKIHKSVLEKLGYEVDHIGEMERLVEIVEQKEYSHILLDANLMTEDSCIVVESLSDLGMHPIIRGADYHYSCGNIAGYTTIKELKKEILR